MKYTILEKLTALRSAFSARKAGTRLLALLLTLALLQGDFMLPAYATEGEDSDTSAQTSTETTTTDIPSSVQEQAEQAELPVDEDTLVITLDGVETSVLELFEYEKVEILAEGPEEQAEYQWQILHPENGTWVNIYDATEQNISVSAALVKNMLNEDGTAALRCHAHTEEYAYLSGSIRVTLLEEPEITSVQLFSLDDEAVPMAEGDDATPEFVTVTIEYIRYMYILQDDNTFKEENVGTAFTSYIATLKSGTDLNTTVPCPTIVGYQAYLVEGETKTACTGVAVNLTNIKEDVLYTVEYHPAEVNYEVRYFFQNIYDDLYVEDTNIVNSNGITQYPVTAQGITGLRPDATHTEATFAGFTSLYYEPETIAADGSTVFHVYYERNYYLMEFDCAGGYGTDTIYVRYGTYISVPDPVRSGWNFAGWDLTGAEDSDGNKLTLKDSNGNDIPYSDGVKNDLPANMPRYNSSYTALWTRSATTFTVIYWVQNANDDGYSYVDSIEKVPATTGDVINLSTISTYKNPLDNTEISTDCPDSALENYVTSNTTKTTAVTVEGDGSTNFNIYFDRKNYYIKFYYARSSGSSSPTSYQLSDNTAGSSNDGGTFASSSWNQFTNVTNLNLNLPTADRNDRYTNGTTLYNGSTYYYFTLKAKYGENIANLWPAAPLTADGYTFVSWSTQFGTEYNSNNDNKNIKGPYSKMDKAIIKSGGTYDNTIGAYEAQFMVAYWNTTNNIRDWTYNIYVKALTGEDLSGKTTATYDGNQYFFWKAITPVRSYYVNGATGQTALALEGYTYDGRDQSATNYTNSSPYTAELCFYYSRNGNTLSFENYGSTHQKHTINYGKSFASYITSAGNPTYPSTLEPGAYYFAGWYTGPNGTGMKVTLDDGDERIDTENAIWYNPTMPDDDLILFAYWKPVIRNVYFYYDYANYAHAKTVNFTDTDDFWFHTENGVQVPEEYPIEVEHGALVGTTYSNIPDAQEGYTFVGWFYMDENNKKRFAPDSMEVKRDLHLFAEWQSGIDTQYTVTYVLANEMTIDGTTYSAGYSIADTTTGHLTAGKTKTFTAKVGTDLSYPFNEKSLFPTINSHSILMDQDMRENTYEFTYVYDDEVYYRVRYVDKITGLDLEPSKVTKSTNAIVTEKFLPIEGYIPENYYIRKVLASDGTEGSETNVSELNEIIFYYNPDSTHGIYVIEYYTPVLGATDAQLYNGDKPIMFLDDDETIPSPYWKLEQSAIGTADLLDAEGNANTIQVTLDKDKFTGFSYDRSTITTYTEEGTASVTVDQTSSTQVSGKVSQNGLEIRIYYKRNSYDYVIEFVEYGTGTLLGYGQLDSDGAIKLNTDGTKVFEQDGAQKAAYQSTINYEAPDTIEQIVDGTKIKYLFFATDDKPQTQSLIIDASNTETVNGVTKRTANVLTFYYQARTVDFYYEAVCTAVDATDFGIVSLNYESAVTVKNIAGSKAIAGDGFAFVGWYSDKNCTMQISTEVTYKPTAIPDNADTVTYYALFEPFKTSLTITKAGAQDSDTSLFRIEGQNKHKYLSLTVAISGNNSATIENIPIDEYKVTELTDWSWKYTQTSISPANGLITVTATAADNKITFTNSFNDLDWLNGECYSENDFD